MPLLQSPTRARRRIAAVAMLVVAAGLLVSCAQKKDPYQTRVVTSVTAEDAAESITPLERGKIRRDVLATARGGMNAWLDDDLEAMPQYFGAEYLDEFKKQATTYADEGKIRVRSHSEIVSNVTKIASSGKQALVEYNFTDDSYFTDTNGKVLSEPDHQKTVFQLTLELTDSDWRVVRIIGRSDSLK